MSDDPHSSVGFIGLGVMGEPMCRNLARKSGHSVCGFDKIGAPLERLAVHGVLAAQSVREVAERCEVIFLSLPSGDHVARVCEDEDGLLRHMKAGQTVVDMSTSPVDLTRRLASAFGERGIAFADAPIARTRQAAEDGTLSIMVGGDPEVFAVIKPLLACCGTDITHCGPVGSGQVVKILNNMVMIETVAALSEALAIARRAGVDGQVLFETLTKGSGDSFALRNHAMKAVLPDNYPERAFSAIYARKDLGYALQLAEQSGVAAEGARYADRLLARAIENGDGERYWPVIARVVDSSST